MKFNNIVNNYGKLYRIGRLIIRHTDNLPTICAKQLDQEFERQQIRIEKFEKLVLQSSRDWSENNESINKYWTGY